MDRGDLLYFQKLRREAIYEALDKIKVEIANARHGLLVYRPSSVKPFTDEILKQLAIIEDTSNREE